VRGQCLRAHLGIRFLVINSPLRVSDDDRARPRVLEHLGRYISGERSGRLGMTILRPYAQRCSARAICEFGEQGGRRAHDDVDRGELAGSGNHSGELGPRGAQSVHLPVSRDQRSARLGGVHPIILSELPGSELAEGQTSRQSFPERALTAGTQAAARGLVAAQAGPP